MPHKSDTERLPDAQLRVRQAERVGVLIDGWNFAETTKTLDVKVDFSKLLDVLVADGILIRGAYFLGQVGTGDQESFLQALRFLGYTVIAKEMKTYVNPLPGGKSETISRCDFGIEFTLHALELAERADRMYLLTGDGDFVPLVRALQSKAVRVIIGSSLEREDFRGKPSKGIVSGDLMRAADEFIELKLIRNRIGTSHHGSW